MINQPQFVDNVIIPALMCMNLHSDSAVRLLLGTALTESHLTWLRQKPAGPARGFYQMEPATHDDIWANYLEYQPGLTIRVEKLLAPEPSKVSQLVTNLYYATAMARLHYRRVKAPLPDANDTYGLGCYWKEYYNTHFGKGKVEHFVRAMS